MDTTVSAEQAIVLHTNQNTTNDLTDKWQHGRAQGKEGRQGKTTQDKIRQDGNEATATANTQTQHSQHSQHSDGKQQATAPPTTTATTPLHHVAYSNAPSTRQCAPLGRVTRALSLQQEAQCHHGVVGSFAHVPHWDPSGRATGRQWIEDTIEEGGERLQHQWHRDCDKERRLLPYECAELCRYGVGDICSHAGDVPDGLHHNTCSAVVMQQISEATLSLCDVTWSPHRQQHTHTLSTHQFTLNGVMGRRNGIQHASCWMLRSKSSHNRRPHLHHMRIVVHTVVGHARCTSSSTSTSSGTSTSTTTGG